MLQTVTGDPIPHATMILEQRNAGQPAWKPVLVASVGQGTVPATVPLEGRTFYRWRFVERPLAAGVPRASWSEAEPTLPRPTPAPTPAPARRRPSPPPPSTPHRRALLDPDASDPADRRAVALGPRASRASTRHPPAARRPADATRPSARPPVRDRNRRRSGATRRGATAQAASGPRASRFKGPLIARVTSPAVACPSGLRSTPRKRVWVQAHRGFKSHRHRQPFRLHPRRTSCPRASPARASAPATASWSGRPC